MLTIVESPEFVVWASEVWRDAERMEFIDWIADNPLAGDVIPGAAPLRKVRWTRAGMGKSSGARVIYYTRLPQGDLVLIAVYAKAKFDNMPVEILKSWKEAYDA